MSKRQLLALCLCSLILWTEGNGILPLLPVYATRLGAAPAVAGYYLAFSYLALALGTVAAGWLSDRFQRRKVLLVVAGVVSIPLIWLMGSAANVWILTVLTATAWFLGGMGLTLISILAGLSAEEAKRGRVFGILALTNGLGGLIGGSTTGLIADRWGYPTMFSVLALGCVVYPLAGLFLEDKRGSHQDEAAHGGKGPAGLGKSFYYLFVASLGASVAVFVSALGRSLAMNQLGFAAAAIASTAAIGGAVSLPLPPLMGWLSDRAGRKRFLALCYGGGMAGLLVLAASVSLWHFWITALLGTVLGAVNMGLGSALVTDLVPRESLGRGMSLFTASVWIGGIVGFAGTGYGIQNLGMVTTLVIGVCLVLIAAFLLIPIRQVERESRAVPAPLS